MASLAYSAAVDYLTTTWPVPMSDSPLPEPKVLMEWIRKRTQQYGATNWVKSWAWQGYVGWSVGPLSWGQRIDSTIVRASGRAAAEWFSSGFPIGHNVSRLDIQVTLWGNYRPDEVIARHKEDALSYRKEREGRPFKVQSVSTYGDGDTLYLGSRTSQVFVRIYNKEAEQSTNESYKGAIRYEIELKDPAALTIAQRLLAVKGAASEVAHLVSGYAGSRGIMLDPGLSIYGVIVEQSTKDSGDLERSLLWLTSQVAPTVRDLVRRGYGEQAVQALGLAGYWTRGD